MLTVIIGRRRQGKSTLALAIAKTRRNTVIVFDPNNQYCNLETITDLEEWMQSAGPHSIGRIVPVDLVGDWETAISILDGGSWRWAGYSLIVDECSMLMNPSKVHWALERYARTCPKDIDVIMTTHRAVDVHTLFRALATDWFFFQQHLDRDLETTADNFGVEVAQTCKTLGNYQPLHFWLDSGGLPKWEVWTEPSEWFVDIGRRT